MLPLSAMPAASVDGPSSPTRRHRCCRSNAGGCGANSCLFSTARDCRARPDTFIPACFPLASYYHSLLIQWLDHLSTYLPCFCWLLPPPCRYTLAAITSLSRPRSAYTTSMPSHLSLLSITVEQVARFCHNINSSRRYDDDVSDSAAGNSDDDGYPERARRELGATRLPLTDPFGNTVPIGKGASPPHSPLLTHF